MSMWASYSFFAVFFSVMGSGKGQSNVVCTLCNFGDIRLVDGSSEYEGRVEVCVDSTWGTVCDDSWDDDDASVVCAQLGYLSNGARAYLTAHFGEGSGAIYLDNVACTGSETFLLSCPRNAIGDEDCEHYEDAGVSCLYIDSCTYGELRLVGGKATTEGRVEICINSQWGTVCDDHWDSDDAMVTCSQLGFSPSGAVPFDQAHFGKGNGSIILDQVSCLGTESSLLNCSHRGIGVHNCEHSEDAGVMCQVLAEEQCNDGEVRLVGGLLVTEGTVEICQSGTWNSLCPGSWGYQESFVVCRELEFQATNVQWYTNAYFGEGHGTPNLTNWNCVGNESSLNNCAHDTAYACCHSQDVGVRCKETVAEVPCIDGSIRLHGLGGPNVVEGRVEYCGNGLWGTVSENGFDTRDGQVVCRNLGFTNPRVQIFHSSYYGQGSGPVFYDDLTCSGHESHLEECSYGTSPFCQSHSSDVGVHCYERDLTTCKPNDTRLVNGSTSDEGRVEVCVNGSWSTVHDENWDKADAMVVCRQLGYSPGYAVVYRNSSFGDGNVSVLVSNTHCNGSEKMLSNCSSISEYSSVFFGHTAGVKCFEKGDCIEGALNLIGGETYREGDVQICHKGVWGYICGYEWNSEEAKVVCQQLSNSKTEGSYSQCSFFSGGQESLTAPIVVDRYTCHGNESTLSSCKLLDYGANYSSCENAGGVMCEVLSDCANGTVKLVGGSDSSEGRVEVCIDGTWTSVSATTWDYNDSRVVCRQLGYYDQWAITITESYFTPGHSKIYYTDVFCTGNEQAFSSCHKKQTFMQDPLDSWYNDERAGVACQSSDSEGECNENGVVRLVDGSSETEGRVEVCERGYWGSVCSDGWSEEDALVVCKQAGYDTLKPVPMTDASFGRGSGPVHMTSIRCTGDERMLRDCEHVSVLGTVNCHHARDAGVVCTTGALTHYSIQASTSPSKGPFPIGSEVHLYCHISPHPPTGSIYQWQTSVPSVSISHQHSTEPNATITIPVGHTKYGYYYCQVQSNGSTLATGFIVIEVKSLLFSSQLRLNVSTAENVTFKLSKTETIIDGYLWQLDWYHNMAETGFGIPLNDDNEKYTLSPDNMSLTVKNIRPEDAGIYTARYDGLVLYPHNKSCEQQLLQTLQHYPVFEPVTFILSVEGRGADNFGDSPSYFTQNLYTTSFSDNEPTTLKTMSAALPFEAIYMERLKDGKEVNFSGKESLFYSGNVAYRELNLTHANNVLHSGYYETQLQFTSNFLGICNSVYTDFITSSSYLGITNDILILQSTLQRMAYYESPLIELTSDVMVFDSKEDATLQCTAAEGYPPIHNMSLVKNGQVVLNEVASEITYTTIGGLPRNVFGLYECVVNNTAGTLSQTILLQHKASLTLAILVDSCHQWDDSEVRVSEVGILGLIEHYCECSVEYTKFYNTTLSCSGGSVTFSSTIAHASDDGAVTATVLVETLEAALSKEDNPTVTINGQELAVSVPVDEESLSASSMGLLVAVIAASCSVHVCMATCIIITCCLVGCEKRKSSTTDEVQSSYNVLTYDARTESAKISRRNQSQPMPPPQQEYVTPPGSSTNSNAD